MTFFGEKTDPKYTKVVNDAGRQQYTNIDAYYIIERATEAMGALGGKWGIKNHEYSDIHLEDGTIVRRLSGIFYHEEGEYPIAVMDKFVYKTKGGYQKVDTDIDKKLMTHFYSKALSYIGLGADVYKGQFDDPLYVSAAYEAVNAQPATEADKKEIGDLVRATNSDMGKMLEWVNRPSIDELTMEDAAKLKTALIRKKQKQDKEKK